MIEPVDEEDTTLLHLAANSSSPEALKVLLQYGADVNKKNGEGVTALHIAAMWGRDKAVKLLLESGSERVVFDEDDLLPLDYAQREGKPSSVCVLYLIAL